MTESHAAHARPPTPANADSTPAHARHTPTGALAPLRWCARQRWCVAVATIVVLGAAMSLAAGWLWRASIHRSERQSFDAAATDVQQTAETLISQDVDFVTALRTGLTQDPNVSATNFARWFAELEGARRQFGGLGTLVVNDVPAGRLRAFQATRDSDPSFRALLDRHILPVAAQSGYRYCLLSAGVTTTPYTRETAELLQGNWCDPRSAIGSFPVAGTHQAWLMRRIAETGGFSVYCVSAQGLSDCFVEAAFYRAGAPLASAGERRAALLGWVSSSFSMPVLASTALDPYTKLSLTLYHRDPGEPMERVGVGGRADGGPRFTSSTTIHIAGTWVARVTGSTPGPALPAGLQGLLVTLAGLLLTTLLATLLITMGRSRERALGLVDEKTGELRHQALHDALTGLPNRVLALDRARHVLARARREQTPVAALYVDIDGFKQVNDTFGHATGDELLRIVAQRLQSVVREGDTAARLGGDEFIVLVEGATLEAGPELVAERVLDVLRQPYDLSDRIGRQLTLTASVGVASGPRLSADELLRDADLALYQAKAAGKNRYVAFRSAMQVAARERTELEMDLAGALERGELFLVYQPTVELCSERVIGLEALIRWQHPQRGLLSPDKFIPLAEESGLVIPIGAWVLQEACRQTAAWRAHGHELTVAVNVSARQLDAGDLLETVRAALEHSGLQAEHLTLEITETALMHDPQATAARLRTLKQLGVRIAIDDFGTGYSSLAYLRQFPADSLKIDRSFVSSIADSKQSSAIIHTLVQLGKTLDIDTLAEGIEDRNQLRALQHEHCDQGQGYLFSRPLAAGAVEPFLEGVRPASGHGVGH
ncbi:MAG TPA: EAL domain-containing protein [Solirubrobacteraceae bacterium]|nr:EAL domain-containing protein [Solirubrobacteraceae bacterium]